MNPNSTPSNEDASTVPPTPIEPEDGTQIFLSMGGHCLLAAGAFLVVVGVLFPARAKGGTCSTRLLWQQRQTEVQAALQSDSIGLQPEREPKGGPDATSTGNPPVP